MLQRSSWKMPGSANSASDTSNTRSTSAGLAVRSGRPATVASTGVMSARETIVMTGWSHPTTVTVEGSSSHLFEGLAQCAGRGVLAVVEPTTRKAHLAAVGAQGGRTPVNTRRASPASSKHTARTAEFGRPTSNTADSLSSPSPRGARPGRPLRAPIRVGPAASRASRTRPTPRPARWAFVTPAQGAGRPGRHDSGRGITCGGPGAPSTSRYRRAPNRQQATTKDALWPPLRCPAVTTPQELQAQADAFGWYHTIDLGNGVVTKGISVQETSPGVIPDVSGRSVLDIGAWDGKFSFAAEKAGASRVVALDHYAWGVDFVARGAYWEECIRNGTLPDQSRDETDFWRTDLPGRRGFDFAKQALDSKVEPVVGDFQKVDLDELGQFDVVLYLGVLYHMKEPLTCLERLRAVTKDVAVIETEAVHLQHLDDEVLLQFHAGSHYAPTSVTGTCPPSRLCTTCAAPPASLASRRSWDRRLPLPTRARQRCTRLCAGPPVPGRPSPRPRAGTTAPSSTPSHTVSPVVRGDFLPVAVGDLEIEDQEPCTAGLSRRWTSDSAAQFNLGSRPRQSQDTCLLSSSPALRGERGAMGQTPTRLRKGIKRSVKRTRNRFDHRLVAHFMRHRQDRGYSRCDSHCTMCGALTVYRLVLHGHRAHLDGIPVGEKFFYSVRDPIDRYVSGFLSRNAKADRAHYRPWTEGEATAFSLFDSPEALGAALSAEDGVAARRRGACHAVHRAI